MRTGQDTQIPHYTLTGVNGSTDCGGHLIITELTCDGCGERFVQVYDDEGRMALVHLDVLYRANNG